eukprot:NODE_310_length_2478_cov_14.937834_g287_i0.p1 GENE.NODE_310_length_2478_cov_14.937834_g287_i0~~NODE_310_length_2478_cov_14.937834_g287_i0.p1  ORF type:complete len:686 (-),score=112.55 NODE_310_length_2478_cov_14.937834_g287_i0:298-2355(-)
MSDTQSASKINPGTVSKPPGMPPMEAVKTKGVVVVVAEMKISPGTEYEKAQGKKPAIVVKSGPFRKATRTLERSPFVWNENINVPPAPTNVIIELMDEQVSPGQPIAGCSLAIPKIGLEKGPFRQSVQFRNPKKGGEVTAEVTLRIMPNFGGGGGPPPKPGAGPAGGPLAVIQNRGIVVEVQQAKRPESGASWGDSSKGELLFVKVRSGPHIVNTKQIVSHPNPKFGESFPCPPPVDRIIMELFEVNSSGESLIGGTSLVVRQLGLEKSPFQRWLPLRKPNNSAVQGELMVKVIPNFEGRPPTGSQPPSRRPSATPPPSLPPRSASPIPPPRNASPTPSATSTLPAPPARAEASPVRNPSPSPDSKIFENTVSSITSTPTRNPDALLGTSFLTANSFPLPLTPNRLEGRELGFRVNIAKADIQDLPMIPATRLFVHLATPSVSFRTKAVETSAKPVWDEEFMLRAASSDLFEFFLYQSDSTGNQSVVGSAGVQGTMLVSHRDVWLPLVAPTGRPMGNLQLMAEVEGRELHATPSPIRQQAHYKESPDVSVPTMANFVPFDMGMVPPMGTDPVAAETIRRASLGLMPVFDPVAESIRRSSMGSGNFGLQPLLPPAVFDPVADSMRRASFGSMPPSPGMVPISPYGFDSYRRMSGPVPMELPLSVNRRHSAPLMYPSSPGQAPVPYF